MKYKIVDKEKMMFAGVTFYNNSDQSEGAGKAKYDKVNFDFDIDFDEMNRIKDTAAKYAKEFMKTFEEILCDETDDSQSEPTERSKTEEKCNENKQANYKKDMDQFEERLNQFTQKMERQGEKMGRHGEKLARKFEKLGEKLGAWAEKSAEEVENWSEKYSEDMEDWAEKFEEGMENWADQYEDYMDDFAEKHGEEIDEWSQKFGKDMESWGRAFGKKMETWAAKMEEKAANWEEKWTDVWDGSEEVDQEIVNDLPNLSLYKGLYSRYIKGQPYELNKKSYYEINTTDLGIEEVVSSTGLVSRVSTIEDLPHQLTVATFNPDKWLVIKCTQEEYDKDWLNKLEKTEHLENYTIGDYFIIRHGHDKAFEKIKIYCPLMVKSDE